MQKNRSVGLPSRHVPLPIVSYLTNISIYLSVCIINTNLTFALWMEPITCRAQYKAFIQEFVVDVHKSEMGEETIMTDPLGALSSEHGKSSW